MTNNEKTRLQVMWQKRDYEGIIRVLRKRYPHIDEGDRVEENREILPIEYLYYDMSVTRARSYSFR
jgi:hypothetical protein